jgi:hypothetical protein
MFKIGKGFKGREDLIAIFYGNILSIGGLGIQAGK